MNIPTEKIYNDPEGERYIADSADVMGMVEMGAGSSIWYQVVVRGDCEKITIGENTNIQDGCTLHADPGEPLIIGDGVTVGHNAILHGCTVGDNALIGMGAIVLNGAVIGKNATVGAGSLVTGGTVVPAGTVYMGSPAKYKRDMTEAEIKDNEDSAAGYYHLAKAHFGNGFGK